MFTYGHRLRFQCFQATTKSGGVKSNAPSATPQSRGEADGIAGKMIGRLPGDYYGSVTRND
jgi:hypothetical protein